MDPRPREPYPDRRESVGAPLPAAPEGSGEIPRGAIPNDALVFEEAVIPPAEALPVVGPNPFFQGYIDGGAPYPEARVAAMVQCESKWVTDPGGYFLGLAQFERGTWATVSALTGLGDWLNPYHQGFNTAAWASLVDPSTSAGWPVCWDAIEWQ